MPKVGEFLDTENALLLVYNHSVVGETSIDILTPDVRSGFGRTSEDASVDRFRQPSAGRGVLWNWNIHCVPYIHKLHACVW